MSARLATFGVVTRIAFRNLFASRIKTVILGGITFVGAWLVVTGSSVVGSVAQSMRRSVVGSVAGHIQVFSERSKDQVEVMGGFSLEGPDLVPLEDFARVRATLMKMPNVAAIVPMGVGGAIVTSGNTIDGALERLRETVRRRQEGAEPQLLRDQYEAQKGHVRQILHVLAADSENVREIRTDSASAAEGAKQIAHAISPAFWADFDRDPLAGLELLENRIAPLAVDSDMLMVRYVGTDPELFSRTFDRMRLVDGQAIPHDQRGFLFSKYFYESELKLKTARRLDQIKEAIETRNRKIANDAELGRFVEENRTQLREILLQLDEPKTAAVRQKLRGLLHSQDEDVGRLLASFFSTTDANFRERYAFFYAEIAPLVNLYRVRIGDTIVCRGSTKGGYPKSVRLLVYGTFAFEGLETSPVAGGLNLMDLVSFRELYGYLTQEGATEIAEIKAAHGALHLSRQEAEGVLFATHDSVTELIQAPTPELGSRSGEFKPDDTLRRPYDPKELKEGVVLNAAILLRDPDKIDESVAEIGRVSRAAGLSLKAVTWEQASGFIGQMVRTMQVILRVMILIVFLVALVIMNNASLMATLERVPEIGTLRALGARRRFVVGMLLVESLVVGLVFGALGATLGGALVLVLGKVGVPAWSDTISFYFSGPRLFPRIAPGCLQEALLIVVLVSAVAGIYPAWLAMRVSPRQAMQTEE